MKFYFKINIELFCNLLKKDLIKIRMFINCIERKKNNKKKCFLCKKKIKMKRIVFIFVVGYLLSGCVTKQKYTECTNDLQYCTMEKNRLATQNLDLQNQVTELEAAKSMLTQKVEKLQEDTTMLGRLNRELNDNLQLLQKNYDDLSSAYKAMNIGNQKESEKMLNRLKEAQSTLDAKEKQLKQLSADLDKKTQDLAEQQAKLNELQAILDKKDADVLALKEKIKKALKGFEGSGLLVTEKNGKVYVSMDEKLLFASGKFTIDQQGEAALKELAKVLESDTSINVMVEGHTDNVPFNAASTAQIRDNWDLSVMRATTVVKTILAAGKNIAPNRLTASGRGEYMPLDFDDTKEARAKNRRTEIILTPNLDALFDILQ